MIGIGQGGILLFIYEGSQMIQYVRKLESPGPTRRMVYPTSRLEYTSRSPKGRKWSSMFGNGKARILPVECKV